MKFSLVLFCIPLAKIILGGIAVVGKVTKSLDVTEEVYWRVVNLKHSGKYYSVDEALRPQLGMSPGRKRPRLKRFEDEVNDGYLPKK